jgi:polyhydroxybutyrate depolymerase
MFKKLAVLVSIALAGLSVARAQAGMERHDIEFEGMSRYYLLHLPPAARNAKIPALLMLHGGGGTPEHGGSRDLNRYADLKGFMVAYPAGVNKTWNDGRLMRGRNYDDVGFLSAVIDELAAKYNADRKRIYVTGMSNGGFMSFTLACRIPQKLAGIATVAGSMGVGAIEDCHPSRAIPVMMINGTADPLVKWEGGKVLRREGSESEPITKVVNFWRTEACGSAQPKLTTEALADLDPNDGSTVEVTRASCPGGEVVNYTVKGGGHTWPGGVQYLPKFIVGNLNHDFVASEAIVDFFADH